MLLDRYCQWSTTNPSAQTYVLFRDITLLVDEMRTPASRGSEVPSAFRRALLVRGDLSNHLPIYCLIESL